MEKTEIDHIKLTKSQENVLKQLLGFVDSTEDRIFILKGYAGTGKTTLMRFFIKQLEAKNVCYKLLASTGRAAKILSNISGSVEASTIHSMVYNFKGLSDEPDDVEKLNVGTDGQLYLVFVPNKIPADSDNPSTVYIVDEASMVSDVSPSDITQAKFGEGRLLSELLGYDTNKDSKFIFVGDPCQLPPIEQYFSPALMKDYFEETFGMRAQEAGLTEIMRQQGHNGLIDISKKIRGLYNQAPENVSYYGSQRLWGYLPFSNCKDILLHGDLEEMLADYVENIKQNGPNHSICICRTNKACSQLSDQVRFQLGFHQDHVQVGNILMVIQNNMLTGLMNGDMIVVESISDKVEQRAQLSFRKVQVKELFTGKSYSTLIIEQLIHQSRLNLTRQQQHALFVDFILRMRSKNISPKRNRDMFYNLMYSDPYLNALRCVYGYAITCHKSQGGEWEHVYMHIPRNITLNPTKETYQWIYTAMTRAKSKLHIVNDFFIR